MSRRRVTQTRPVYLETGKEGESKRYLIDFPWIETSGQNASPFKYNNSAHAGFHSLLAALRCNKKSDVLLWLINAQNHIAEACNRLARPSARVIPAPKSEKSYRNLVVKTRRDLQALLKKGRQA
jgi:hypothetical protein